MEAGMIHVRVTRNSSEKIDGAHIAITEESMESFTKMVNRALNTWDDAPKDLKELGDMLVHGRVLQDYS
jgi:hypothetical protein